MKNPIITTRRLFMREFLPKDAQGLYLLNADQEVLKHTGDQPFASLAEANEFINTYNHYEIFGMGRWTVIHHSTEAFMGWCGLKTAREWRN